MKYENVRLNEENEEREKERERARIALEVTADYEKRREERRSIENSWVLNMNFLCGNQYCDVSPIGGLTEEDPQFYWQSRRVFNHIAPTIESRIAKLEKVRWWNDGKCYFFVEVKHASNKIGVVRNHWYNLTINSISGLGTPVADPNDDIVPEKLEDEQYFVAAQVQILKWKMVSQSVSLE